MCIAYINEYAKSGDDLGICQYRKFPAKKTPAFSLDLGQSWVIHGNSQIKWLSTWGPQRRPEMGDGKGSERIENHEITMKHKDWLWNITVSPGDFKYHDPSN